MQTTPAELVNGTHLWEISSPLFLPLSLSSLGFAVELTSDLQVVSYKLQVGVERQRWSAAQADRWSKSSSLRAGKC